MKSFFTIYLLLLVCIVYAGEKEAEPEIQNSLSISAGYDQIKEENLHLKVNRGLILGINYQHSEISRIISEYGAGLKVSILNTMNEEFASSYNIQILGNYKYLFTVFKDNKIKYYLGPAVDLRYGTSAYFNWDESHLYWANYLSAGIENRISYNLLNKTINFSLGIPVVSAISRSDYNRQFKIDDMRLGGILKNLCSNVEGALPNKHFYLNTGVELVYPVKTSKKRSIGYNFRYHYMHASKGLPFHNIEHSLSYKFIF